ncbi:MAG: preprotein translocase subunit SecE [Lachnospiraceae bacterium]|jgi:preprotein translocase subunit SecE|nr:preprotein translocase subunit SecE [Lachnospiraceae bacterium]MEE1051754.1 preprotein translocase subunit SecE [Lachnospiraceae bacterium]
MSTKNKKEDNKGSKAGFFQGVKTEFKKIIWPDRDTLGRQLLAVVCVTVVMGILIAVIDFGAQNLINLITTIGA